MKKFIAGCLVLLLVGISQADQSEKAKKLQEIIKNLKDGNPKVRLTAVQELGKLAAVRVSDVKSALPTFRTLQKDSDPGVRHAVLETLALVESEKTYVPILTDALKRDKDMLVRQTAVTQLLQLGEAAKPALPVLKEVQKSLPATPTPAQLRLRLDIFRALTRIETDPDQVTANMIDTLKYDKEPVVRTTALRSLQRIDPPPKEATPVLLDLLKASLAASRDAETSFRRALLDTLTKLEPDPESIVPVLIDVVKRDKDMNVRMQAVTALGNIGPPAKSAVATLKELQKLLKPKEKALTQEVLAALEKIMGS